jgi:hypothetical protein
VIHQQIRPSQFITTYGPGSIVETRSGPVVICSTDRVFSDNGLSLADFEIRDSRLARTFALNGAGIIRIPVNAEVTRGEEYPLYPTEPLPYWSLCVDHRILYWARNGCPQCPTGTTQQNRQKAGREAIRFVRACAAGHLDDVDWHFVVHNGPRCQGQRDYYLWIGGGSSLRNVNIRCPQCPAVVNFGIAYRRDWRCSARYPELGARPAQPDCSVPARIVQRGSANLRIPEIISALTIPPLASRLTNVLQDSRIMTMCTLLSRRNMLTEAEFRQSLNDIQPPLGQAALQFLGQCSWAEIEAAIRQVAGGSSSRPLKEDEFDSLRYAAVWGAPPVPSPQTGAPPLFEVRLSEVRRFDGPAQRCRFRVVPVSRLRMVMVQRGYRRLDPSNAQLVSVSFQSGGRWWYPGAELFGEGVFIDIEDQDLALVGTRALAWERSFQGSPSDETLHPVHVWWHTLSHRLLRALSVDSGYSSAAIRERLFLKQGPGQQARGGVLLYTVQPGGDGTLGGLISLVPSFGRLLNSSLRDLGSCSNDPLCEEALPDGINGSACYSCLLASETSCEQRNIHLDRGLLLDNMP